MGRKIILDLPNEEALKLLDEDIKALRIADEEILTESDKEWSGGEEKAIKLDGSNRDALEEWKREYSKMTPQEIEKVNASNEELFGEEEK